MKKWPVHPVLSSGSLSITTFGGGQLQGGYDVTFGRHINPDLAGVYTHNERMAPVARTML